MADNTPQRYSDLTTKQKVVGVLTIVIVIFVVYEVIGLFSSPSPKAPEIKPATTTVSTAKKTTPQPTPGQPQNLTAVNVITPSRETNAALQQQQQQQQAYLDSLNQLQLLKVKREIAETNQAIASARLATETANKNMSDLLTQPGGLPQTVTVAPGSKLATSTNIMGLDNALQPKPQAVEVPFVVISVSMQLNRWNAVLSYQGKFYSVSVGDTLLDGSVIASINKNGVIVTKDGKRRTLSIQTSI